MTDRIRLTPAEARRLADDPKTPAALRDVLTSKIRSAGTASPKRPTTGTHVISDSPAARADALLAELAEHGLAIAGNISSAPSGGAGVDAHAAGRADALLAEFAEQGLSPKSGPATDGAPAEPKADALLAELEAQGLSLSGATRRSKGDG